MIEEITSKGKGFMGNKWFLIGGGVTLLVAGFTLYLRSRPPLSATDPNEGIAQEDSYPTVIDQGGLQNYLSDQLETMSESWEVKRQQQEEFDKQQTDTLTGKIDQLSDKIDQVSTRTPDGVYLPSPVSAPTPTPEPTPTTPTTSTPTAPTQSISDLIRGLQASGTLLFVGTGSDRYSGKAFIRDNLEAIDRTGQLPVSQAKAYTRDGKIIDLQTGKQVGTYVPKAQRPKKKIDDKESRD